MLYNMVYKNPQQSKANRQQSKTNSQQIKLVEFELNQAKQSTQSYFA